VWQIEFSILSKVFSFFSALYTNRCNILFASAEAALRSKVQFVGRLFIWVIGLLVLLAASTPVWSQPVLINQIKINRNIAPSAFYLDDIGGQMTIEQIEQPSVQNKFVPYQARTTHSQINPNRALWIKLDIQNQMDASYFIEIVSLRYDSLAFFSFDPITNRWKKIAYSGLQTYRQRNYKWIYQLFEVQPNSHRTYYFRLRSHHSLDFQINLLDYSNFLDKVINKSYLYGLYYGFAFLVVLFGFLIYLSTRLPIYLYYTCSILGAALGLMALSGHGFVILWPNLPILNYYFVSIVALSYLPNLWFTVHFLKLHSHHKPLAWIAAIFPVLSTATVVANILGSVTISTSLA
jgi:hypothetical protein